MIVLESPCMRHNSRIFSSHVLLSLLYIAGSRCSIRMFTREFREPHCGPSVWGPGFVQSVQGCVNASRGKVNGHVGERNNMRDNTICPLCLWTTAIVSRSTRRIITRFTTNALFLIRFYWARAALNFYWLQHPELDYPPFRSKNTPQEATRLLTL